MMKKVFYLLMDAIYPKRLKESGMLTSQQMGAQFGVSETTVINWRKKGLITILVMQSP